MSETSALVLFSGGQDSATCVAWALNRFDRVETIGFDYGQRHHLSAPWAARLGEDRVLDLTSLGGISDTALTTGAAIAFAESGLPNTFVPGRNLLFLTYASAVAYRREIKHLVTGVCETDFSGYPDCRDDTIKALQVALNLGMEKRFVIDTPLMWIDKAQTWALAHSLGGQALVDLIIEQTHTCYQGDREHHHPWGFGCGSCPACELRAGGYTSWTAAA
jgi:7-cyano-7-deazaguanine synthase